MLFYIDVYLSKDVDAQVLYNTLRDRFGEDSPKLYAMKATLLQINDGDQIAIEYIEKMLNEKLEYDTDSVSYVLLQKRLIAIKAPAHNNEWLLSQLLELSEKFPLDSEIWWMLGNTYMELGQFESASYCYEEVVILLPFNYVAFAQLAEALYYKANRVDKLQAKVNSTLQMALNNALRSVEISELYLKGWCFIAKITSLLNEKKELRNLSLSKISEIAKYSNKQDQVTAKLILNKL